MSNIWSLINEEIRNNPITKEEILNEDSIMCSVDDNIEIIIKNTFENISNFIIMKNYAMNGNSTIDFYINHECFMNTIGHYINLCSNLDYLEELKKTLIPLQLEYEKALMEGCEINKTFLGLVNGKYKEFKMITNEYGDKYFRFNEED